MPRHLGIPKVHYRSHARPPLAYILDQMNHTFIFCFLKIQFAPTPKPQKRIFPSVFPTVILYAFLITRRLRIFLFTTASRMALGPTQPPIQWEPGLFPWGVKRPGREADHSPPSSAKVKNVWSYTSIPPLLFMEWCLVNHRDKFVFTFFTFTHVFYMFCPSHPPQFLSH
jgi:hypothetical protein